MIAFSQCVPPFQSTRRSAHGIFDEGSSLVLGALKVLRELAHHKEAALRAPSLRANRLLAALPRCSCGSAQLPVEVRHLLVQRLEAIGHKLMRCSATFGVLAERSKLLHDELYLLLHFFRDHHH